MDTKEVVRLAKELANGIRDMDITRAEVVMIMSLAKEMVLLDEADNLPPTTQEAPEPSPVPAPVRPKHAGIQYDPLYDPPPPDIGDKLPPPQEPGGLIIAKTGQACLCTKCNAVVYTINRDIPDNCKIPDFIASFTPFGTAPPLTNKAEVQNIDGKISTDCPLCKGSKCLYLIGK